MKNAIRKISAALSVIITVALLPCGCEKVIRFDGENLKNAEGITLNALATTDTNLMISVSKAYLFSHITPLYFEDFYHYEKNGPDSFYFKTSLLPDAELNVTVNGRDCRMRYDPKNYLFTSDYRPAAGDRIRVLVKSEGFADAYAEAVIPEPQRIEVVKCEKFFDKKITYYYDEALTDMGGADTIARITLRIADPKDEHNYYRLVVRSIAHDTYYDEISDVTRDVHRVTDIFTSSDIIFNDQRLFKGYGGWKAYFTNVFEDRMFNGKEYEFDIETRMRYGDNPRVEIELQSITSDFYHYLRALMLYRITDQDSYSETIHIHSNVENGFGIVGGLGTQKHVIYLQ